ncbi:MAG TPA: RimK family alpha-L-glutamate ligase [Candidatus Limnocylindria bacterium]|nr:RimK family alpha-L-glutamate ligase [Candidatus Limnocylindria bacterium]
MPDAWLVTNAFLKAPSFAHLEAELLAAARRAGIAMQPRGNDAFVREDALADAPRAALFFDKDVRLAQRLEARGVRVFNPSRAIEVCDDKTATWLALESAGLPQPETVICPATFPGLGYGDAGFLHDVAARLGFPMVVKEARGSFGEQVYLVHEMEGLRTRLAASGDRQLLFQRFIAESAGVDLRLYVVGNAVAAAIRRENRSGDFRANVAKGGTASAYTPTQEEETLALAACRACGADFAGVDLLLSHDGPLVCEVNSNAHFRGLAAATGVNPADGIMRLMKAAL